MLNGKPCARKSYSCYLVNKGKVNKVKNYTPVSIPDCIIKIVSVWGCRYQEEEEKNKIHFLNLYKQRFDWDSEEYNDPEGLL